MKVSYRENEWTVVWSNPDGERQLTFCNTKEEAIELFNTKANPLGVMPTMFYSHYIDKLDIE